MRCFGLTPEQVLSREPAPDAGRFPSLPVSILYGTLSFTAVSTLAYSIWARGWIRQEGLLYTSIAAVYLAFGGFALSWLVKGSGTAARFALLFAAAFVAYAVLWCAFWFGLRGKYFADLWGAAIGLAPLTWLMLRAFGQERGFLCLFISVFLLHSAGYYLGDYLHDAIRDANGRRTSTGRLMWGLAHGLGFGAGIGLLLYFCQAPIKLRLASAARA